LPSYKKVGHERKGAAIAYRFGNESEEQTEITTILLPYLDVRETEVAIKLIKDSFQRKLSKALNCREYLPRSWSMPTQA